MNRNTLILIAILVVLAAVGIGIYQRHAAQAPATGSSTVSGPDNDSPDAIDRDLNSIDTGTRMDVDLEATDKDIQNL